VSARLERVNKNLESGRMARQLEKTHDANDAEKLEKVVLAVKPRQQEVEIERDGRHEVDDVDRCAKKAQDVWTDGKADEQLEGEPGITGALDVEESGELIGRSLVQHPHGATAVGTACRRDVYNDRYSQVWVCFETEYCDGDENKEDRQCRNDLRKDHRTTVFMYPIFITALNIKH